MSSPLISVVVSTHAAERHIRGCLEMLLRQTVADRLEIIVIDSGSGSGSPELERTIVEALQRQHHNIVYLRTPRETLYAAWNRALSMSSGKYFANVNTDDWIRAGDGGDRLERRRLTLDRLHLEGGLTVDHLEPFRLHPFDGG